MPILETAPVDVALVLAVDCSSSVDAGDYRLQMDGIAKAVRHPRILEAIKAGPLQRMALCLVQWSNRHNQTIAVPWAGLSDQADIEAFAVATEKAERHWTPGGTGLGAAMAFCTKLLLDLSFPAVRRVIDISGDGADNENGNLPEARQIATANAITINGLPLIYGQQRIADYYLKNVICGPEAFVIPTQNLQTFPEAMQRKLLRELRSLGV